MMIRSAGFLTFVAGAGSCEATAAAEADGLVITEILADPPEGIAGDANDDGERDPADDEFVEIANQGTDALCLSGWMMGDAQSPDRHVFPLGPMLAPGQSLIVFGGGVPTGAFNGAQVQWSTRGLSLSNAGDVLTLRDVDDVIVKQVSWGDCAGTACATDHWSGELGINASLTRLPHREARWEPHAPFGGLRYSPGLLTGVPGLPDR